MYALDLKTQTSYTSGPLVPAALSAFPKTSGLAHAGQTVYPVQGSEKSMGAMEYSSRIFSPYLTPSAIHAVNRQISQASRAPTYQQSIAITKYLNISTIPQPRSHIRTSLVA